MKVYFSCSITGGRSDQPVYRLIVDELIAKGHTVLTAELAAPDLDSREGVGSPKDVYQRDVNWLNECDMLVAEVSTPSHGVGYEIAYALQIGKPVCCFYERGKIISKMLTGNNHPGFMIIAYSDLKDLTDILRG